jgi:hypothetical protein
MRRVYYVVAIIVLIAISFFIGTKAGRYLSSVERENLYPYHLGDIWVNNQPICDDYYSLIKKEEYLSVDIVKDNNNQRYVKIISLPSKTEEGKLIYSILNRDQEQFIDELWLDCK